MRNYVSWALLGVLCTPSFAQEREKFWTKKQITGTLVNAAIRSLDTGQTCYHLSQGWHEVSIPSQNCGFVIGWNLGAIGAEIGTSYLFHKLGWKKMQTINPYLWAAPSAQGIIYSYTHGD